MHKVHIDFETQSEVSVTDVGACAYAAHPSTSIMCLSYAVDDGPVRLVKGSNIAKPALKERMTALEVFSYDSDVIFTAHNALFEQEVWRQIMANRYGYGLIGIRRWRCSAAKAAAHALPRDLKGLSHALKLPQTKDMEGHRVMMKLSRPRKVSAANPDRFWTPETAPDDFETLYKYNMQDVEVERLADNALPDLNKNEQRLWFLDQEINQRGVQIDVAMVKRAIEYRDTYKEGLKDEFRVLTKGYASPTQLLKFQEWTEANGVRMSNMQASSIDHRLALHDANENILPDAVFKAFKIRRQLAKTSTAKYDAMLEQLSTDGRLRDMLMFHAASTGRWAGKGAQLHNLPRPKLDVWMAVQHLLESDYETFLFLYPNLMEALSWMTRGAIIATPGHVLYVADFSAIEARVNAWLAGHDKLLALFANDDDVYSYQATEIYGYFVNRKLKHQETEGMVGKTSILALGYQGGISAFGTMAISFGLDLAPLYPSVWAIATPEEKVKAEKAYRTYRRSANEPLSEPAGLVADIIKQKWRAANQPIVKLWDRMEAAAIEAVEHPGRLVKCGKVHWAVIGDFLYCRLPSGRRIAYHEPQTYDDTTPWGTDKKSLMFMGVDAKTKQYTTQTTYGGKLVENVVQAISRDIMAEAWLRVDDAGYTPILSVHDESLSEVPADFGSVPEYEALMSVMPAWASGLPIKAEGWCGTRYKK